MLVLLVIVLVTAGGGEESPSGEGDRAEKATPAPSSDRDEKDSGDSDEQQPQAPAEPAPQGGGGDAAATVDDFYQRAARGDYDGAWALATPRAQAKLGGFESFRRGQSSLESISFPRLKGKEKGDAATVQLRSEAVHSDRIDRCKGTIELIRSGGAWMLDDFHIAGCAQSPRP